MAIEDPKELLLHVLHAKDASRDRSTQTEVGPSEIGGCRRKVWYRLNAQPATNENQSKLAAIMGTAIHAAIEEAIGAIDPEGKEYLVETEVAFGDMKAHVDLFVPSTGAVIDWKTSKVRNMSYFPSNQQTYGAMCLIGLPDQLARMVIPVMRLHLEDQRLALKD